MLCSLTCLDVIKYVFPDVSDTAEGNNVHEITYGENTWSRLFSKSSVRSNKKLDSSTPSIGQHAKSCMLVRGGGGGG